MMSLRVIEEDKPELQAFFAKTIEHMVQQGERSWNSRDGNPRCCYRMNKDGKTLSCAIGCHITDEEYNPLMEGYNVRDIVSNYRLSFVSLARRNAGFMTSLQNVHDYSSSKEYMKECLDAMLSEYGWLKINETHYNHLIANWRG